MDHLQEHLEWTFRLTRRHSTQRGLLLRRLLEQAVVPSPLTYAAGLAAAPRSIADAQREALVLPPPAKRVAPPPIALDTVERPWRRQE